MMAAAWLSLALSLSAQAGVAIWWAGAVNTRLAAVAVAVRDLQSSAPAYHDSLVTNERGLAVTDQRLDDILRRLEAIERRIERLFPD